MRIRMARHALALGAVLTMSASLDAQGNVRRSGVMGELLTMVTQLEGKMMGLAKAIPEPGFAWRPPGARSTSEVLMHVAADNYLIPGAMGLTVPTETGINPKDYKTAQAFEQRKVSREQAIAEMEKSFVYLKQQMMAAGDATMDAPVSMFGSSMTTRGAWILATTHLHEHLGQLIAYARSNNVKPPWSQ